MMWGRGPFSAINVNLLHLLKQIITFIHRPPQIPGSIMTV
jgi:hypothetical protein